jgi:hypothetical protein
VRMNQRDTHWQLETDWSPPLGDGRLSAGGPGPLEPFVEKSALLQFPKDD